MSCGVAIADIGLTLTLSLSVVGQFEGDVNGMERPRRHDTLVAENPSIRFYNGERGYVRCTVTPGEWRSDYRVVEEITRPGATVTTGRALLWRRGRRGGVVSKGSGRCVHRNMAVSGPGSKSAEYGFSLRPTAVVEFYTSAGKEQLSTVAGAD
jgi:hypothetical protein